MTQSAFLPNNDGGPTTTGRMSHFLAKPLTGILFQADLPGHVALDATKKFHRSSSHMMPFDGFRCVWKL